MATCTVLSAAAVKIIAAWLIGCLLAVIGWVRLGQHRQALTRAQDDHDARRHLTIVSSGPYATSNDQ